MDAHFHQQVHFMQALEATIASVRTGGPNAAVLLLGLGRLDFIDRNLGFAGGDAMLDNMRDLITGLEPGCRVFRLRDARYGLIVDCDGSEAAMEPGPSPGGAVLVAPFRRRIRGVQPALHRRRHGRTRV
ncbi:MAG: hypothetical protein NVV74_17280 [Magnetospirillum sp.]|nr:hypothetical protein [Magnetospirillum sp.]